MIAPSPCVSNYIYYDIHLLNINRLFAYTLSAILYGSHRSRNAFRTMSDINNGNSDKFQIAKSLDLARTRGSE